MAPMGTAKWQRSTKRGELRSLKNIPAAERKRKNTTTGQIDERGKHLEMRAYKTRAEHAHVQPSCVLTTAFEKIAWCSRVPLPCCAFTTPRVPLPLPTIRGCASWDSSRRNRGPFIRQERARRILFAQVFANCRPPPARRRRAFPDASLLEHDGSTAPGGSKMRKKERKELGL